MCKGLKQIVLLFVVAVIAVVFLYTPTSADEIRVFPLSQQIVVDGVQLVVDYNNQTHTASIKRAYYNTVPHIYTIPSEIVIDGTSYRVVDIGFAAFQCCTNLYELTIPETIEVIGAGAFSSCNNLRIVNYDCEYYRSNLYKIDQCAFSDCRALESIVIPPFVSSIGERAFEGCQRLSSVCIQSIELNRIEMGTFAECSSLVDIKIPYGVESIGEYAFQDCNLLENVTLPSSVTSIGNSSFCRCRSLKSITLPAHLNQLGTEILAESPSNISIHIPCLADDTVLGLTLSDLGLGYINNSHLTLAQIMYYDDYYGNTTVSCDMYHLNVVYEPTENELDLGNYNDVFTASCSECGWADLPPIANAIELPFVQVNGVEYAFDGEAVCLFKWHDSREHLGGRVCFQIPSYIQINGEYYPVVGIADNAFEGCEQLNEIAIPSTVECIGNNAFSGCTGLEKLYISDSVTNIGVDAFAGCNNLASIAIPGQFICSSREDGGPVVSSLDKSNLKEITLGYGITYISNYTFCNCSELVTVNLPETIDYIGEYAFADCVNLESIVLPNSLCYIGSYAFLNCSSLNLIEIPSSVTTISSNAFEGCSSLTAIDIPSGVTSVDSYAFNYCPDLEVEYPCILGNDFEFVGVGRNSVYHTGISIPGNLDYCSDCFDGLEIDGAMYHLYTEGYDNIASLYSYNNDQTRTSFYIPSTITVDGVEYLVTSIEAGAFEGNTELSYINIPSTVTSIGDRAFADCSSLKSIVIPVHFDYNGSEIIYGCNSALTLYIPCTADNSVMIWTFENGRSPSCELYHTDVVYRVTPSIYHEYNSGYSFACMACGQENPVSTVITTYDDYVMGRYVEVDGVEFYLNDRNFTANLISCNRYRDDNQSYDSMIGYQIPSTIISLGFEYSVVSIEDNSFEGCTQLEAVEIPDTVTTIGDFAFYGCTSLERARMANSVTSIGGGAFYGCDNLKSLVISSSINQLGNYALGAGNDDLRVFCLCDGIAYELNGSLNYSDIHSATVNSYYQEELTGDLLILPYISIGGIVYDVEHIEYNAFNPYSYDYNGCAGVTSITIPESVQILERGTFDYCENVAEVTLPIHLLDSSNAGNNYGYGNDTISSVLGEYFNTSEITSVTLTGDGSLLPSRAFYGCSALETVNLPNTITEIGDAAFCECYELRLIELPNSLKTIGNDSFGDCSSLNAIEIPNSVTTIGCYAFYGCNGLTSLEIPSSVTVIGSNAFNNCYNLTQVTIPARFLEGYDSDYGYYHSSGLGRYFDTDRITTVTLTANGDDDCRIPSRAFYNCQSLTTVNIPETINYIYLEAFSGCTGLTSIDLPNSLLAIGGAAFEGCTSLTEIIIPENVTLIDTYAFFECSGLASVEIPSNVNEVGNSAFEGCYDLVVSYPCSSTYTNVEDWGTTVVVNHLDVVVDEAVNPTETEIGLTEGSHCEECGKVFVAQEEIPVLVHTHTVVIDPEVAPTATEPGLTEGSHCSVCGEVFVEQQVIEPLGPTAVYGANILGHSLALDGTIGVYFYYEFTEDLIDNTDAYVRFTYPNGGEVVLPAYSGEWNVEVQAYGFRCDVAAKEMTDNIAACVIVPGGNEDGSDWVSATTYYSVRDYANYILDHASEYAAEVDMVRAMLTYGTYAQLYFGYNTGDLAISLSDPNACSVDWVGLDQFAAYRESAYQVGNRSELVGLDLVLESETTLELCITYPDGASHGTGGSSPVMVSSGNGYIEVTYWGITAASLDDYYICDSYIYDDEIPTGSSASYLDFSFRVSPFTYAYIVLSSENDGVVNDSLKDLMRAMYVYNYYANQYFGY